MKKKSIIISGLTIAIIGIFNFSALSDDPELPKSCLQEKAYYTGAKAVITGSCWDQRGSSQFLVGSTQNCIEGTEFCIKKECEGTGCVFQKAPPLNPPD
jgi:hypothetical protein